MNQMEGRKKATEMPIGPTMSLRSLYSSVRNLERVGLRYAGLRLGITQIERNQQGIGVGRSRFLRRRFRLGLRRFCTLLIDRTARTTMQRKQRLYDSDWDRTINSWTSLFHFEIRSLANNGEKHGVRTLLLELFVLCYFCVVTMANLLQSTHHVCFLRYYAPISSRTFSIARVTCWSFK